MNPTHMCTPSALPTDKVLVDSSDIGSKYGSGDKFGSGTGSKDESGSENDPKDMIGQANDSKDKVESKDIAQSDNVSKDKVGSENNLVNKTGSPNKLKDSVGSAIDSKDKSKPTDSSKDKIGSTHNSKDKVRSNRWTSLGCQIPGTLWTRFENTKTYTSTSGTKDKTESRNSIVEPNNNSMPQYSKDHQTVQVVKKELGKSTDKPELQVQQRQPQV